MGLDMYLYGERYISSYTGDDVTKQAAALTATLDAMDLLHDDNVSKDHINGFSAKVTLGYWRKAWPIHNWLVENVQNGNDDCGEYRVQDDVLRELLSNCIAVLSAREDPEIAHDTAWAYIPPSDNYESEILQNQEEEDYYYYHIQRTATILTHLLTSKFEDYDFYYSSSW
jgi:hypothetical protein